MECKSEDSVLTLTVQIKRADTGVVEDYTIVCTPTPIKQTEEISCQ